MAKPDRLWGCGVLTNDANGVNLKAVFQTTGTIRSVSENTIWTYEVLTRPDGSVTAAAMGYDNQNGDVIA
ncbi:MAG: hypothetical protein Ct9H300mP27_06920 [Chloroflexota bacterium]|nr:MAG: hypothetical protein Ct9H300mP27_06920 [Chloroflexota bacterium]